MNGPRLIIGLGTGRCGTRSLKSLLSLQPDTVVCHERNPHLSWENDVDPARHLRYGDSLECDLFADIAFYYLPHVERLRREFPGVRFVCLQRNKQDTIRSFETQRSRGNRWFCPGESGWARSFPVIDGEYHDQVSAYWDMYYETAEQLAGDDFRIFPTEALSDARAEAILEFCGFESPVVAECHVGAGAP